MDKTLDKTLEITEDYTYLTVAIENTELVSDEEQWVEVQPGDPASREVEMTTAFVLNGWSEREVINRIIEKLKEEIVQKMPTGRRYTQREVIDVVCKAYNTSIKMIRSDIRKRGIVEARQLICYLLRKLKDRIPKKMTYEKIGGLVNKDHATVKHAERVIQDRVDMRQLLVNTNKELNMLIEAAQNEGK